MKAVIVVGIVIVVLLLTVMNWSLCVVSGRENDDEEQMKYLKGIKKKDDDVPM